MRRLRRALRPLAPVLAAASAASTACAPKRPAAPNDLGAALADTRRAIAAARARLDTALTRADRAALTSLLDDSVEVRVGASHVALRGRETLLARLGAVDGVFAPGAVALLPQEAERCLAAGYEAGTYTRYRDSAGTHVGVAGGYAIAWRVREGRAAIRTLVVDTVTPYAHAPRGVGCERAAVLQRRASRFAVSVGAARADRSAPRGLTRAASRAGWTAPAARGQTAVPPCDPNGAAGLREPQLAVLQLSARVRLAPALGAEVVSAPSAMTSCYHSLNAATQTVVSQSTDVSDHSALLNVLLGNVRVGVGVAYVRAHVRSTEDSVGAAAWLRANTSTRTSALGLAGQAVYSLSVGRRVFAEVGARGRLAPAMTVDRRLLHYTPPPVSLSGYALSAAMGMVF